MSEKELICSFCGLSKVQTNLLVAGQEAHICDTCIEQAYGIVVEEAKKNETEVSTEKPKIAKPKEIKSFLNKKGQVVRKGYFEKGYLIDGVVFMYTLDGKKV